jgi:hypothetical protein
MARDDGALVPHNVSRMFAVKSSRDPPQTKGAHEGAPIAAVTQVSTSLSPTWRARSRTWSPPSRTSPERGLRKTRARSSGRDCRAAPSVVRLQLQALALLSPQFPSYTADARAIKDWSLTSLKEKLIKIGAKVGYGRYVTF